MYKHAFITSFQKPGTFLGLYPNLSPTLLPTFSRSSLCLFMHFFLFSALPVNVESQSQLFL